MCFDVASHRRSIAALSCSILTIGLSPFTPAFDMAFCIERRSRGTNNSTLLAQAGWQAGGATTKDAKAAAKCRLFAQKMPQGLLNRCLALSSLYAVWSFIFLRLFFFLPSFQELVA